MKYTNITVTVYYENDHPYLMINYDIEDKEYISHTTIYKIDIVPQSNEVGYSRKAFLPIYPKEEYKLYTIQHIKKMTVEEIEKELGYPIVIVK